MVSEDASAKQARATCLAGNANSPECKIQIGAADEISNRLRELKALSPTGGPADAGPDSRVTRPPPRDSAPYRQDLGYGTGGTAFGTGGYGINLPASPFGGPCTTGYLCTGNALYYQTINGSYAAGCQTIPFQMCQYGCQMPFGIDAKIEGLKQRGFDNPTKLITSSPAILGYAFENIDRKIRLLYFLHGNRAKAIRELEAFPALLGYKWRRLLFAVRTSNPDGLRKLITISPQLLATAKGKTGSDNPARLATAARALKGLDTHQIIEELVNDKRIDPRLIRALERI